MYFNYLFSLIVELNLKFPTILQDFTNFSDIRYFYIFESSKLCTNIPTLCNVVNTSDETLIPNFQKICGKSHILPRTARNSLGVYILWHVHTN